MGKKGSQGESANPERDEASSTKENSNADLESQVRERTAELETANEALREIKAQFEAVYNHHYQLTGLIDKEGRLLMANRTALEFAGVKAQDVVGKHFWETPWWTHSQREQRKLMEAMKRAMRGEMVHFESTHVSVAEEMRNIDFRIRPVFDDNGEVIYLVPEGYDITERLQAEEALRKSEEKYRTFFQNSRDPMLMLRNGLIVDCNAAAVAALGYRDIKEILDLNPAEISPEYQPDRKKSSEEVRKAMETAYENGTHRFEWEHRRKNGDVFPVEVSLTAIPSEGDIILHAVWWDISFRKEAEKAQERLEAQLRQTQKMEAIGTLAGGIAHDFNNILTPIIAQAELTKMTVSQDDSTQTNLDEIIKAGQRAKELVTQILTFSRQSDQQSISMDLVPIVKETLKFLWSSIPKTIEIRQHIGERPEMVLADPTQVQQVVMNLCTNAAQAMQEKGNLDITLGHVELDESEVRSTPDLDPGHYVMLRVSDTGSGIEAGIIDKIFDPFFTTKAEGEGTGMGLSVVHGIVQSFKGAITVDSEPGKGSTFTVYFPKMEKEAELESKEASKELPTGNEQILFVDDEVVISELGREMLETLGYQVETRTSSIEALAVFQACRDRYDLVITDIDMPNVTGKDLAKELMKIRPDIPIIMCTGFSHRIDEKEAKAMGIRAFIMKPFLMRDFAETVREILDAESG